MTNHIGAVYAENETKLSWPIRLALLESNLEVDLTSYYRESTEL